MKRIRDTSHQKSAVVSKACEIQNEIQNLQFTWLAREAHLLQWHIEYETQNMQFAWLKRHIFDKQIAKCNFVSIWLTKNCTFVAMTGTIPNPESQVYTIYKQVTVLERTDLWRYTTVTLVQMGNRLLHENLLQWQVQCETWIIEFTWQGNLLQWQVECETWIVAFTWQGNLLQRQVECEIWIIEFTWQGNLLQWQVEWNMNRQIYMTRQSVAMTSRMCNMNRRIYMTRQSVAMTSEM